MYVFRPWHWFLPVSVVMIGFYVHRQVSLLLNMRFVWEVALFVQLPLGFIASCGALFLWQAGLAYQNYLTKAGSTSSSSSTATMVKPGYRDLNKVPVPGVPGLVYNQTTTKPQFDMERQFAKALIVMHDFKPNDEAVDLREETWKRPNKFGSRDAYVLVREKWEAHQIVMKSAARKNAPYRVVDWRAVELIANGNPLPQ